MYDIEQLNAFIVPELKEIAEQFNVKGFKRMAKMDLVHAILDAQADKGSDPSENQKERGETPKSKKTRPARKASSPKRSEKGARGRAAGGCASARTGGTAAAWRVRRTVTWTSWSQQSNQSSEELSANIIYTHKIKNYEIS